MKVENIDGNRVWRFGGTSSWRCGRNYAVSSLECGVIFMFLFLLFVCVCVCVCVYKYSLIAHNRAIRPSHPSQSIPLALILPTETGDQ